MMLVNVTKSSAFLEKEIFLNLARKRGGESQKRVARTQKIKVYKLFLHFLCFELHFPQFSKEFSVFFPLFVFVMWRLPVAAASRRLAVGENEKERKEKGREREEGVCVGFTDSLCE